VIISINVVGEEAALNFFALQGNNFFAGKIWTLITSMFVHIQIWHILANMFSLFFIGNFVEKLIGRKRFFWVYLVSGIFAGLVYVFLSYFFGGSFIGARLFGSPDTFAVGASGAVFSQLGLLAVLTPYNSVFLIVGPLIAIIAEVFFAKIGFLNGFLPALEILISIYILIAIFSMFSFNSRLRKIAIPIRMHFWLLPIVAIVPLVLIGLFVDLPIGNSAHVGGLIAGLVYAFYLRNKYKKKTDLIRRYFKN
jgi:membrane associated rhomboid family serine protease